ncbi:hypothetical protein GN956_G17310 [Arapaima gigas]
MGFCWVLWCFTGSRRKTAVSALLTDVQQVTFHIQLQDSRAEGEMFRESHISEEGIRNANSTSESSLRL